MAFSCEATPIPKTDVANGLLLSSFREENTIIGQAQMQGTTTVTSNPGISTTTSPFITEQYSAEVGTEQSTITTEIQTVQSSEINEISADNHKTEDNKGTQIVALSETTTTKDNYLHSVITILRLLARALKAAPHFFG